MKQYDAEREAYISKLEAEVAELRDRNGELTTLLMRSTSANEQKTLQLILSGHFDNLRPKTTEGASSEATGA